MAKDGKVKIPKKVAGVKVPKALRKNQITALIDTPLGREILADAIVAAAAAAAAVLVKNRPSARQIADAGEAAGDAAAATRDTVQNAAGAVAGLVTEAAQQLLPASLGGKDDEPKRRKKDARYAHMAEEDRKGRKDKNRTKPSKH